MEEWAFVTLDVSSLVIFVGSSTVMHAYQQYGIFMELIHVHLIMHSPPFPGQTKLLIQKLKCTCMTSSK